MIANLAIGLERFLQFAKDVGAVDAQQQRELWERGWHALIELGQTQGDHIRSAEPTARFLELLQAAIASGDAHVASPSGETPESAGSWGWRLRSFGSGNRETDRWEPQGRRIGWLNEPNLYLEPEASFAVCQRLGQTIGEPLVISQKTLEKRLHERGLLASVEKGRRRLRVRVRGLEGLRRPVLHLLAASLFPNPTRRRPWRIWGRFVGPLQRVQQRSVDPRTGIKTAILNSATRGRGRRGRKGPVLGHIRPLQQQERSKNGARNRDAAPGARCGPRSPP